MDSQESASSAIPLPDDVHSPDYIAAYSSRVLAHIEEFPELAAPAELLTMEATPRGILMQAAPDYDHGRLILRLRSRLNRGLGARSTDQADDGYIEVVENVGLVVGSSVRIPDITVVNENKNVRVRGGKIAAPGVMLVVEVTSTDRNEDLNQTDPSAKPRQYAAAKIPLYLVIDRKKAVMLLFAEPEYGNYPEPAIYDLGDKIWLPKPLGFYLETDFMKPLL